MSWVASSIAYCGIYGGYWNPEDTVQLISVNFRGDVPSTASSLNLSALKPHNTSNFFAADGLVIFSSRPVSSTRPLITLQRHVPQRPAIQLYEIGTLLARNISSKLAPGGTCSIRSSGWTTSSIISTFLIKVWEQYRKLSKITI